MKLRLSRTGLIVSAIYGAMAIPLLMYAYLIVDDFKGSYVLKQLAAAPALLALDVLVSQSAGGLPDLLNSIPVFLLMSFVIVYGVGWLIEIFGKRVHSKVSAYVTAERVRRAPSLRVRISRGVLAAALYFGIG